MTQHELNALTSTIIGAAIEVHKELGPGLVENAIIVEIKAVELLLPIHGAQLLTYLKLLGKPKGILINFNCMNLFKEGQKTYVTDVFAKLPKGY